MQLFKGKFYYCDGPDVKNITTKADCTNAHYRWVRRKYNFDNLGQVKPSLQGFFCASFSWMSSRDVWLQEGVEPPSEEVSKIDVAIIHQRVDIYTR